MQLDALISSLSLRVVILGSLILLILVLISLAIKNLSSTLKKILFFSIIFVVFFVTIFLAGSTIYLNNASVSKGPVHYHADFEIWNCGKEVDLKDPKGFSNKIGTPTLHEHNDKRIHLEGVVVDKSSATLGRFFEVIGGNINSASLSLPTNNGQLTLTSGDFCSNGKRGVMQVFVYKVQNGSYYQKKIENPQDYVFTFQTNVPPADCIIIELDSFKQKTDRLCRSYKVAIETHKLKGETQYGN